MDKRCIKKIGILRALQLGDLLCSIPAIRALKLAMPDSEIFLIGLPNASGFVQRFPHYFNGLIKFPGYPGLPEQPYEIREIAEFIPYIQKHKFDLILQMQGNGNIVNPLVELLGALYTAGFYRPEDYIPEGGLFLPYPSGHEVERHLALMQHLGIESSGTYLEFPLTIKDEAELTSAGLSFESGSYVCVHPGSRGSWRQWPPEYFAALADMAADLGKKVVLTGTIDEMPIAEQTASLMKHQSVIAAGNTTLGSAGVLIRDAFALISNCTGVSHIASAVNTPGIIISMDGEPERWGPLNNDILITLDWSAEPHFAKAERALKELFQKLPDKASGLYSNSA